MTAYSDYEKLAIESPRGLYINHFGLGVRRVHSGYELICEVQQGGDWVEFWRTNEMSNDYAYSESQERCLAKVAELQFAGVPQ